MLQRPPSISTVQRPRGATRVFAIPIALGFLSAVGLVAALLGDGLWDGLSWLTLGIPVAVIAFAWSRRPAARPSARRGI
jgi:hypothetical protein